MPYLSDRRHSRSDGMSVPVEFLVTSAVHVYAFSAVDAAVAVAAAVGHHLVLAVRDDGGRPEAAGN